MRKYFRVGLPMENHSSFRNSSNRLRIQKDNQLILLENFILDPQNDSVYPWRNSFPSPFYGCIYLASPKVAEVLPCRQAIHNMMNECLIVGVTSMHRNAGWIIKGIGWGSV